MNGTRNTNLDYFQQITCILYLYKYHNQNDQINGGTDILLLFCRLALYYKLGLFIYYVLVHKSPIIIIVI